MPNKFQLGKNKLSVKNRPAQPTLLVKEPISHHHQQQQQGKATKKAPEGAFESAPYPGLKESTEVESVHYLL